MSCSNCGMATKDDGEFHPHEFCLMKQAGIEPWVATRRIVKFLYGIDLPADPPHVRNLPLKDDGLGIRVYGSKSKIRAEMPRALKDGEQYEAIFRANPKGN